MSDAAADGLLVIDKPAGWTSHDVVARGRRLAGTRKVGHAGTLDPMATGVLILGVGKATKLLGHLSLSDKTYEATIRLGGATTTDDAEGEPIPGAPADGLDRAALDEAIAALTGDISQVPSSVSAIKVDGKRSYARVRAGEDVALAAREVRVSEFRVVELRTSPGWLDVDAVVSVSSGTYIRALARDLGSALGVGGHLTALRRTRVGDFTLAQARTLEESERDLGLIPLADAVSATFDRRELTTDEAQDIGFGRSLEPTGTDLVVGAFDASGACVALVQDRDGRAKPIVVFVPA